MDKELTTKIKNIILGLPDNEGGIAESEMDEGIEQIKAAFKEAGYERRGHHTTKRPGQEPELIMTGKEWLNLFKKEMGTAAMQCQGCSCDAMNAARRVAGVK